MSISGNFDSNAKGSAALRRIQIGNERVSEGILVMEKTKKAKVVHQDDLLQQLGVEEHNVQFAYCCPVCESTVEHIKGHELSRRISKSNGSFGDSSLPESNSPHISLAEHEQTIIGSVLVACEHTSLQQLYLKLIEKCGSEDVQEFSDHLQLSSLNILLCLNEDCPYRMEKVTAGKSMLFFCCSWSLVDEKLALRFLLIMKDLDLSL